MEAIGLSAGAAEAWSPRLSVSAVVSSSHQLALVSSDCSYSSAGTPPAKEGEAAHNGNQHGNGFYG
uniref:Uncharacterized protein n=1 Tax=Leersia perrieri TaxID=77586 RepID=A0A0D9UZT7_9ORYZ